MNNFEVFFDKNIYSKSAIQRALYDYLETFYIDINDESGKYKVLLESKDSNANINGLIKDLKNKVLEEEIRINLENETKSIREEIFKRAMQTE